MTEVTNQNIKVSDLMTLVRKEAEQRRKEKLESRNFPIHLSLPRLNSQQRISAKPGGYHLNDFLQFHDRDFIVNAYRGLLLRDPDIPSLDYYLARLRDASQSKTEILGRLRFSPEGRLKGVKVSGLIIPLTATMLYKIPIIGWIIRVITGILRLPVIIRNMSRFEAHTMMLAGQHRNTFNQLSERIEGAWEQLGRQMQTLYEGRFKPGDLDEIVSQLGIIEKELQALRDSQMKTAKKVEALRNNQIDREKQDLLMEFIDRVKVLEDSLVLKADTYEVNQLKDSTAAAIVDKADSYEVNRIKEEFTAAIANKADAHEIVELRDGLLAMLADKANSQEFTEIRDRLDAFSRALAELDVKDSTIHKLLTRQKRDIILQERRINFILEEARARLPEPFDKEQLNKLDNEYQHRLDALYVSFEDEFRGTREEIKERARIYLPIVTEAGAGTQERPILDIGCGRGEWLELLHEEGLTAFGIDLNRVLVQQCADIGLTVYEAEALCYLRESPDNSLGAITGIHIIEHLSFDNLVALLDECLRALKPGGLLIFETPNPENLIVGACNFYFDPTHLRPLPPPSMEYMLETRGFLNLKIIRQNPMSPEMFAKPSLALDSNPLLEFFLKEQDYAILGYKP
ncbi:methyltransferase domain-containing protein [Desulfoferrobacter suflitae]|uniref:methyltransferase domain-containing protein n=1 Tax=Desulfoferrobacter suflitae TaxID=2865782 RepID=UPI002164E513|nr:methyltransferase domain-containing protein [Desulfoferrobacter suflitae]MCK8601074.1 methyltransferase domain-containing protein [Desulfoferrobacter suflitae]